jgi:hypothetical protein
MVGTLKKWQLNVDSMVKLYHVASPGHLVIDRLLEISRRRRAGEIEVLWRDRQAPFLAGVGEFKWLKCGSNAQMRSALWELNLCMLLPSCTFDSHMRKLGLPGSPDIHLYLLDWAGSCLYLRNFQQLGTACALSPAIYFPATAKAAGCNWYY